MVYKYILVDVQYHNNVQIVHNFLKEMHRIKRYWINWICKWVMDNVVVLQK